MPIEKRPTALLASAIPVRAKPTVYPEPFASRMAGRSKRQLGEMFGLSNFGVNLTHLATGRLLCASPCAHEARRVRLYR
jgi:uncharacterized cupin superfamily protein